MINGLVMTIGLPGCGKSTWALQEVERGKGRVKRVNKDDLRTMVDGGRWSRQNEKQIIKIQDRLVRGFLEDGFNVIVDNTGFGWDKHFCALASEMRVQYEVQDFTDVPLEVCIARDLTRLNSVGKDVIVGMWEKWLKPPPEVIEYVPGLPNAVLVDIDGTLAHLAPGADGTIRNVYDGSRVHEDALDEVVASLVRRETKAGRFVIVMSGRDSEYREVTERWLSAKGVHYDALYMRAEGDKRKDSIVKRELFDQHVRGRFNVLYVLDDRDQVVRGWRQMGLKCLQVAEGNF
jgi:predicted kinase